MVFSKAVKLFETAERRILKIARVSLEEVKRVNFFTKPFSSAALATTNALSLRLRIIWRKGAIHSFLPSHSRTIIPSDMPTIDRVGCWWPQPSKARAEGVEAINAAMSLTMESHETFLFVSFSFGDSSSLNGNALFTAAYYRMAFL